MLTCYVCTYEAELPTGQRGQLPLGVQPKRFVLVPFKAQIILSASEKPRRSTRRKSVHLPVHEDSSGPSACSPKLKWTPKRWKTGEQVHACNLAVNSLIRKFRLVNMLILILRKRLPHTVSVMCKRIISWCENRNQEPLCDAESQSSFLTLETADWQINLKPHLDWILVFNIICSGQWFRST